jgi:hypothetical protein
VAAASIGTAGTGRPRPSRTRWAVVGLLAASSVLVPTYVALVVTGGPSGVPSADAGSSSGAQGATDRAARITFHLGAGALGLRLLRDAPPSTIAAVQGRRLDVLCGYPGEEGLSLLHRTLRWPAASRTARLRLDRRVLASADFCALSRGGRGVARVVFR